MASWGIAFGDTVLEGDFTIGPNDMNYASGTGIGKKLCISRKKNMMTKNFVKSEFKFFCPPSI